MEMPPIGKKFPAEMIDSGIWCFDKFLGSSFLNVLLHLDPAPSRERVVRSLKRTICQMPILGSHLERGFWRDRWVPISNLDLEGLVEDIDLGAIQGQEDFEAAAYNKFKERIPEGIDLGQEPPIKVIVFRNKSQGLLIYRIHHSIADGNGCLQILHFIGENLNKELDEETPSPVEMNRSFFKILAPFGIKDIPGILHDIVIETFRPWTLLFSRPLWRIGSGGSGTPKLSLARLSIKTDDYRKLHARARENGLTMNDLLATALLALCAEFNGKLPRSSPYLNVNFTVNLRRFFPASQAHITNLSAMSGLSLRPEKVKNFKGTAKIVREKVGEVKRHYIGLGSILVPQLMTYLLPAGLMRWFLSRYGAFTLKQIGTHSTAVTNIGAMDNYAEVFGKNLKSASVIAPAWEVGWPIITATGLHNSLTLYFALPYRNEKDASICRDLADRLRYFLLEWCLK